MRERIHHIVAALYLNKFAARVLLKTIQYTIEFLLFIGLFSIHLFSFETSIWAIFKQPPHDILDLVVLNFADNTSTLYVVHILHRQFDFLWILQWCNKLD